MIPVRFVKNSEDYSETTLPAVPRGGDFVHFGDQHEVFRVVRVIWEPYYSDGFSADRGRATVVIKDS